MHVCKEKFIGCFRTITSLIHWAFTIFNEVQIYRFLDSPTQKCSISKSVKYFTLHPDIKLSLFSTGKWKCLVLKYKRREEEEVISLYSFHNLMSRDLQNLKGGSSSSLSSLFFHVECTLSDTLDELSSEIKHWHTLLALSVGCTVHITVSKSRKFYWVSGRNISCFVLYTYFLVEKEKKGTPSRHTCHYIAPKSCEIWGSFHKTIFTRDCYNF